MKTYYQTDLGAACEHISWLIDQEAPYCQAAENFKLYMGLVRVSEAWLAEQGRPIDRPYQKRITH